MAAFELANEILVKVSAKLCRREEDAYVDEAVLVVFEVLQADASFAKTGLRHDRLHVANRSHLWQSRSISRLIAQYRSGRRMFEKVQATSIPDLLRT